MPEVTEVSEVARLTAERDHLADKMERAVAAVAHFTLRDNESRAEIARVTKERELLQYAVDCHARQILDQSDFINVRGAELAALKQEHQRLFDLVRYCRHTLLVEGLISQEEYAVVVVGGSPGANDTGSVKRLETYDEHEHRRKVAERERDAAIAAVCNSRGDDLCWITDTAQAKALPEVEFMESCRRYRAQIAAERGEFTGGKTIAQLEAEVAALKQEQAHAPYRP